MTTSNVFTGNKSNVLNILSWFFGIAVFAAGIINTFWGNDPFFGIFLVLLSFVYFPLVTSLVYIFSGFSIPWYVKLLLTFFIIMAVLGVGELFDKIEIMRSDLM